MLKLRLGFTLICLLFGFATAQFQESPMLAEQVEAGTLPPVAERLPATPQVVTPLSGTGEDGGTLRQGIVGTSVTWGGGLYTTQWEGLVQWQPDFQDVEPSLAERIEVSDDAREYTFYFRDGIKWSDGQPFGADDILFYINDVVLNPDLNAAGTADWLPLDQTDGFSAEKVGENGVKLTFPNPNGTLLLQIATWIGRGFAMYPKHYLSQFHKTYNPDVDKLAEEAGLESWMSLFYQKGPDTWGNPDRLMDVPEYPSLGPWTVTQPIGSGTTARFVRNPYYWKVDDKGNQLPYMDEVLFTSYQDPETRTLAMLNGDLDYVKDPGNENRAVYFDALDQGKAINVLAAAPGGGNTVSVHFNMASKDAELAKIFQNKDFRIGMSHAINRPEIIEVVFQGQGEPAQVGPWKDSPLYNEQLSTQYTEYNVDLANEYLDKVLPNKDSEGFRLREDGSRLSIIWTLYDANANGGDAKTWLQSSELMVGHFAAVGIETKLDVIADAVVTERRDNNDIDMFTYHGSEGGAGLEAMLDPRWHIPGEFWGVFSLGWFNGRDGGNELRKASGVPMPEEMQAIRDAWSAAISQPTLEAQIEAMKGVMQTSADNFWVIGISRPGNAYQPISTRLQNFPDNAYMAWLPGSNKITRPEQWFIQE
jgi:peptide/nickel transport system substrate-binding protein